MSKDTVIREKESKTDIAYRVMLKKKKERSFYDLWEDVKNELAKVNEPEALENIDEDISFFYTNLTLDGRFVNVGEDSKDEFINDYYEDSYDDSTGSDADINQYRDQKSADIDEE